MPTGARGRRAAWDLRHRWPADYDTSSSRYRYSCVLRIMASFVTSQRNLATLCLLACLSAASARAQTRGMIINRTGDILVLNGSDGKTTVVLTDDTDTKDDRGLFGLEKEHLGDTVLIPGLKVKVDGSTDSQGRLVAKTITVDGDDLDSARARATSSSGCTRR
jgi:hypothetical protein